jgi:hypothetical protein
VNSRFFTGQHLLLVHQVILQMDYMLPQEALPHQVEPQPVTMQMDYTPLRVLQTEVVKARSSRFSCEQYIEALKQQVWVAQAIRPSTAIFVLQQLRVGQQQMTKPSRFIHTCDRQLNRAKVVRQQSVFTSRREQFKHSVEQQLETMQLVSTQHQEQQPELVSPIRVRFTT